MTNYTLACVLLLWSVPLAAQGPVTSGAILGASVPCDGIRHHWHWWNTTGGPVRIVTIKAWRGATYGARADVFNVLWLNRGGGAPAERVLHYTWDRYSDSVDQFVDLQLTPNWIAVPPLASLTLEGVCYPIRYPLPDSSWVTPSLPTGWGHQWHTDLQFWFTQEPTP